MVQIAHVAINAFSCPIATLGNIFHTLKQLHWLPVDHKVQFKKHLKTHLFRVGFF